jgi:hypothetical protein
MREKCDEFKWSNLCWWVIVDQLSGAMYCIAIHDIICRVVSLSLPLTVPVSRLVGPTFLLLSIIDVFGFFNLAIFFLQNLIATVESMAPEVQNSSLVSFLMVLCYWHDTIVYNCVMRFRGFGSLPRICFHFPVGKIQIVV